MASLRCARINIVDHVFSAQEMKGVKWSMTSILRKLMEDEVHFAASVGLISNSSRCEACEIPRSLVKRKQLADGYQWRCKDCRSMISLRKGSFIEKSHLKIKHIAMLLFSWSVDMKLCTIQEEISVSSHAIVDWLNFIREVCEQDLLNNPIFLGGLHEDSSAKEVEIDESYFFRRKYNRRRVRSSVWVFGAMKRGSNKCNIKTVEQRDRESLLSIIRSWILPGTRIISDGWAAYDGLQHYKNGIYQHATVVHKENFVNPDDETVHTYRRFVVSCKETHTEIVGYRRRYVPPSSDGVFLEEKGNWPSIP